MIRAVLLALLVWAAPASAAECENIRFEDAGYTICTVDLTSETLRLFLYDDSGAPYGQFGAIESDLNDF